MLPLGDLESPGVGVEHRLVMSRQFYCGAFAALLAAEIYIALFVRDTFVRPYLGDVLVIVLLYCLARGPLGLRGRRLVPAVTAVGAAAECLQYFRLADRLGLAEGSVLRVILGSTFDWTDLLCYLSGGALLAVWEMLTARKSSSRG